MVVFPVPPLPKKNILLHSAFSFPMRFHRFSVTFNQVLLDNFCSWLKLPKCFLKENTFKYMTQSFSFELCAFQKSGKRLIPFPDMELDPIREHVLQFSQHPGAILFPFGTA